MRAFVQYAACLFVISIATIPARCAEVAGTVRDHVGATQPRARVLLLKRDRSVKVSRETGTDGQFRFADLTPGEYQIKVSSRCFQTFSRYLRLDARSQVDLEINLKLADKGCVGID
jgi:hypothetical protein